MANNYPFPQQFPNPDYNRLKNLVSLPNNRYFDMQTNFLNSLSGFGSLPFTMIDAEDNILVRRAVRFIANAVIAMPWVIAHEDGGEDKLPIIKELNRALLDPNSEDINSYDKVITAVVNDLIRYNVAVIGRKPRVFADGQAFYLYVNDPKKIQRNNFWKPELAGVEPRFFFKKSKDETFELLDSEVFLIQSEIHSDALVPKSPLQTAFDQIKSWQQLYTYQSELAATTHRDTMLVLEDANAEEVNAFREYWANDVEGRGKKPIMGGSYVVKAVPTSQKVSDEFSLSLAEYFLRLIGMNFGLSPDEMGVSQKAGLNSGAGADVAATSSFLQAVKPIAQVITHHLSKEVISYYYPGYSLKLADINPRNEGAEADTAVKLFDSTIITRDEARARVGEKAEGLDLAVEGKGLVSEGDQDGAVTETVGLKKQNSSQNTKEDKSLTA
jgi:hypothetical protein